MTNNSPPNSFFSLVLDNKGDKESDNESAAKPDSEEEFSENRMVNEETQGSQVSENAMGLGESTSLSSEDEALATSVMQSDSAVHSETMPHDARRVLVHLMRQGSVMASQKSKLFELLCRHESAIRKHLSEVYLRLVLDQKMGVAFVASADYQNDISDINVEPGSEGNSENQDDPELDESTTLIPKRTLSLYDTLILLVLRKHYQDRESAGEQKITIDIERLESYLTPFLPITDHASKDRKKLLARVKEMVKRKVLSTIRGADDRYEITPIIRYVVSASFLESMLAEYTLLAQQTEDASVEASPINNNGEEVGEVNE
ncbi:hypothetical protein A3766_12680 [Oleiphilus sp. HI0132]|uniref:DUF4194 domain-containing protein n=2 Tax=Oleiphilus sp. HI0132 TaxID=1822270 RepID=UPI0007C37390|nr:DUF4194 domain-containing protein [Oleiphilus sp. HI0132]KZZ76888.1 hypothetical protein A3766_12680 [Oleiphilus sp. HI0132]